MSGASWGLGHREPGWAGAAGGCTSPTVLRAQQAVEDLLHHDGVELDELGQGLDHLFLRGKGREGRPDVPFPPRLAAPGPRLVRSSSHAPHDPPPPPPLSTGLSPQRSGPGSAPTLSHSFCVTPSLGQFADSPGKGSIINPSPRTRWRLAQGDGVAGDHCDPHLTEKETEAERGVAFLRSQDKADWRVTHDLTRSGMYSQSI